MELKLREEQKFQESLERSLQDTEDDQYLGGKTVPNNFMSIVTHVYRHIVTRAPA